MAPQPAVAPVNTPLSDRFCTSGFSLVSVCYFRGVAVLCNFIFLQHWLQLFSLSGSSLRVDPDSVSFRGQSGYWSLVQTKHTRVPTRTSVQCKRDSLCYISCEQPVANCLQLVLRKSEFAQSGIGIGWLRCVGRENKIFASDVN